MDLDYNVSSGPFLSFQIEIGDGPGPELDKNVTLNCFNLLNLPQFDQIEQ